jgi:hypothetical protein
VTDTTTITDVPVDAGPPIQAVVTLISDAEAAATSALTRVDTLTAENSALTVANAALKAQLGVIEHPRIIGAAAGTAPSYAGAWTTLNAAIGPLDCYRDYEKTMPTDFASTHAAKVFATPNPPSILAQSLLWSFDAGPVSADQAAATFARQVPAFITYLKSLQAAIDAGVVKRASLCPRHEPEQAGKEIDPPAFGAAVPKWLPLMAQYAPSVEPSLIFMTYTSTGRTPGDNEWLAHAAAALHASSVEQLQRWLLWDGYLNKTGPRTTPAAVWDEPIAYGKQLLPNARQGVAEWGVEVGTANRAQLIADTAAHLASMEMLLWFNSVATYTLTGDDTATAAVKALAT